MSWIQRRKTAFGAAEDGTARPGRRRTAATLLAVTALAAGFVVATGLGPAVGAEPGRPHVHTEWPVTATDLYDRPSNNSPLLAVDPTEPRFVAMAHRLDAPFNCALQASGDAGRSWVTALPVRKLPAGADTCYGPEVAFDRDGVLYYLFVGLAGAGNNPIGAYLTTSADRARTFSPPIQVLGPDRYMVRMVIDPAAGPKGRIHLVWLEAATKPPSGGLPAPPNPIMAAHSDDGGRTFSRPTQVSDTSRPRAVAPSVVLGTDHALHVLYYDLGDDARDYAGLEGPTWDGTWSLVLSTSTDGGRTFSEGVVVDDQVAPPERVMLIFTMPPAALAAGPGGALYVAWTDARNGDWDILVRRSADGGRTWAPVRRLNDDRLHNGRHQYLPRLSVAPGGRLDVVFYDRRGNVENRGNDVYYSSSVDAGSTYSRNLRLTSWGSDSLVGPMYTAVSAHGQVEFGSRLALLSERSRALAAWTDTRHTARGNPAQDIFATEVDYPTVHSPGQVRVGAGVLAMAGLAALVVVRGRSRRETRPSKQVA